MRSLREIALEIRQNWSPVNYAAAPYLDAMLQLDSINDMFMQDSARSVVLYFLNNAKTWRGPVAQRIKAELKAMLAGKNPVTIGVELGYRKRGVAPNPVTVSKLPSGKYRVRDDGRITAYGTTRKKAERQARLLRAVKHGFKPTGRNPGDYAGALCWLCRKQQAEVQVTIEGRTYNLCKKCQRNLKKGEHPAQSNPRGVPIYSRIDEIYASKAGMPHKCDAKCAAAGHRYVHKFDSKACIVGLPDGSLLVTTKK